MDDGLWTRSARERVPPQSDGTRVIAEGRWRTRWLS